MQNGLGKPSPFDETVWFEDFEDRVALKWLCEPILPAQNHLLVGKSRR